MTRFFTIQGELTDLNSFLLAGQKHRLYRAKIKREETQRVVDEVTSAKVEKVTEYPVEIRFTWYCSSKKKDPDNIIFAKKFILDGLVSANVLESDGWRCIDAIYDQWVVDKENPRIEIEII